MTNRVRIVKREQGNPHNGHATEHITLREDFTGRRVRCENVLIMETTDLKETFEEWLGLAEEGEEGFSIVV